MNNAHQHNCDECYDRLEVFALGELKGEAGEAVARHLQSGCQRCNAHLGQILADLTAIAHGLPRQLPPLRIERELLERIDKPAATDVAAEPVRLEPASPHRDDSRTYFAAAITIAACLLGVAAWLVWSDPFDGDRPQMSVAQRQYWEHLEERIQQAEESQHVAPTPRLEFAYLRGPIPENRVHGYVASDELSKQWHVYVFNLPALAADRRYQLWFISQDEQPIPAGMLDVDSTGNASLVADLPEDAPQITGLAISDEPTTGSEQPSGEWFFATEIPRN